MTNTQLHARRELNILLKTVPDTIIRDFVPEILALCEAFGNFGQNGGSASYTAKVLANTIKKLCLHQPICPITGIDEEWDDVSENCFQNIRCPALFKDKKTNRVYYVDAIIWKTQKGIPLNGTTEEGITSCQFIKSFPFKPKTFIIDVIKEKDWKFKIKDKEQLKAVAKYYDFNLTSLK